MRIVLYGNPLGDFDHLTNIPFMLDPRIERIYKDGSELQDLECDIAIANFVRPPEYMSNDVGFNHVKLPKVKVQLAIQAEHYSDYIPEWVDGYLHNFDGSICFPFNAPFWEFDESIHPCFAKSYWESVGAPIKPRFYFDPLVKWNNFYKGPVPSISDHGYTIGGVLPHRDSIIQGSSQFNYMLGDMRKPAIQKKLIDSGIGFNIHKFELERGGPKAETIRLAFYYNLGMAVVSEKLDKTFPERMKDCVLEVDDMRSYVIDKDNLRQQTLNTEKVFNEYHDLFTEFDILFDKIQKEYKL